MRSRMSALVLSLVLAAAFTACNKQQSQTQNPPPTTDNSMAQNQPPASDGQMQSAPTQSQISARMGPETLCEVVQIMRYRMASKVKGFGRRPLARGGARHGEAGVRKPPKEETAFRKGRWRRSHDLWGFEDRRLSAPRS